MGLPAWIKLGQVWSQLEVPAVVIFLSVGGQLHRQEQGGALQTQILSQILSRYSEVEK